MDIAANISHNLKALMVSCPERETLAKVATASKVGVGTMQRAKSGDGNITVQNLELIAHTFRRTARDLLQGYRDASAEGKEIMFDLARKAAKKKDVETPSETND